MAKTTMTTNTDLNHSGLWRRAAAATFDAGLGLTISIGIVFTLGLALGSKGYFIGLATSLTLWLMYSAGLESSDLQSTLGGRIFALKVTDAGGNRMSFWRAVLRQVFRLLPVVFILAAIELGENWLTAATLIVSPIVFLLALFNAKRQALFDIVAKTLVSVR
jgi:uncharacterized RDD family membrane protein YckC